MAKFQWALENQDLKTDESDWSISPSLDHFQFGFGMGFPGFHFSSFSVSISFSEYSAISSAGLPLTTGVFFLKSRGWTVANVDSDAAGRKLPDKTSRWVSANYLAIWRKTRQHAIMLHVKILSVCDQRNQTKVKWFIISSIDGWGNAAEDQKNEATRTQHNTTLCTAWNRFF